LTNFKNAHPLLPPLSPTLYIMVGIHFSSGITKLEAMDEYK
jgi:hypothetical protein